MPHNQRPFCSNLFYYKLPTKFNVLRIKVTVQRINYPYLITKNSSPEILKRPSAQPGGNLNLLLCVSRAPCFETVSLFAGDTHTTFRFLRIL